MEELASASLLKTREMCHNQWTFALGKHCHDAKIRKIRLVKQNFEKTSLGIGRKSMRLRSEKQHLKLINI